MYLFDLLLITDRKEACIYTQNQVLKASFTLVFLLLPQNGIADIRIQHYFYLGFS